MEKKHKSKHYLGLEHGNIASTLDKEATSGESKEIHVVLDLK